MSTEPRNPEYAATVRRSFEAQGVMTLLGASLVEVAPGHVEIEVVPRPELSQQQGFLHAGVTTTILDSACGYAGLTLMPEGSEVLTVELKVNLLAPAAGDRVVARGRVVRSGRTLTVAQGDAYAVTGGDEVHCATITATLIRVDAPG